MVDCLGNGEAREDTVAHRQHDLIMHRFRGVLEENPGEPIYVPEICKAIRVADRTLRTCCHEQLGMGPKRYLLLRRLNLARQALRKAEPDATRVTKIATEYGFWQLGRFAGEYQSLFGESPSATLAGNRDRRCISKPKLHSRPKGRTPTFEAPACNKTGGRATPEARPASPPSSSCVTGTDLCGYDFGMNFSTT